MLGKEVNKLQLAQYNSFKPSIFGIEFNDTI